MWVRGEETPKTKKKVYCKQERECIQRPGERCVCMEAERVVGVGKTLIPAPPPTTKGDSEHGRLGERPGRMHRGREREIWIYTAYVYACIYTCTYTRSRVHRCTPAQSESRQAYCTVFRKQKIDQEVYRFMSRARPNYTFLWAAMDTLTRCPDCGTCGFRIFRGSGA